MADRSRIAIFKCGRWLAQCLQMGWSRDQLDALEELWWEHHDERGNLTAIAVTASTPIAQEGQKP